MDNLSTPLLQIIDTELAPEECQLYKHSPRMDRPEATPIINMKSVSYTSYSSYSLSPRPTYSLGLRLHVAIAT